MSATADPVEPRIADQPFGDPTPAPAEAPAEPAAATSELDDIERQVDHRVWKVVGDVKAIVRDQEVTHHVELEYTQKPLSYTSMIQFTGLLGRKIDESMSGPDGLSLQSVTELGDIARRAASGSAVDAFGGALARDDFSGIDAFIQGFAKLASYVPDIIDEAHCIWLRVPFHERMVVREIWGKPVDEGGMSMDEGEEMLLLFIRQNYEELERFFVERLRRIGQEIQKERKRIHPSD